MEKSDDGQHLDMNIFWSAFPRDLRTNTKFEIMENKTEAYDLAF